jgi:hypothetical protein
MKPNLPAPTAQSINEAHQCAMESAENAVEWAIKCGQLLAAKKEELKHGEFQAWIEKNCKFAYSTASRYMKAAQNSTAVEISSLSRLFPSGAKPKSNTPKGAVSVVKAPRDGATATEETGEDRPAASATSPERASQSPGAEIRPGARPVDLTSEQKRVAKEVRESIKRQQDQAHDADDAPERPDDIDEDTALAAAEADYMRRVDAVMQADDKLAEAQAQLRQQAALISTLEATRDGYMRGKDAVTKLLQAEQRKVSRLEKENKALRDRLAVLEGKAA